MIKYTSQFLLKLEDMVAESDYTLRYEKGNFKAGFCVLKDQKIMIINKFFTTEGKINALLEILKGVTLDPTKFTEKSLKLHDELVQNQHIQQRNPQQQPAAAEAAAEQPAGEQAPAEQAAAEQSSTEQPSTAA
jgi:hypothetical protein